MKEGRVLMTLLSDMVFKKMNEALKVLWDAKVTIITKDLSKTNEIGLNDDRNPEVVAHDLPCKVSTTNKNATAPEGDIIKREYDAVLFLDNSVVVPTGAILFVTDANGNKVKYKRATGGYTAYRSHQEVGMLYSERK